MKKTTTTITNNKIIKTICSHEGKDGKYGLTINGIYMERHEIFRLYEEIAGFITSWNCISSYSHI